MASQGVERWVGIHRLVRQVDHAMTEIRQSDEGCSILNSPGPGQR